MAQLVVRNLPNEVKDRLKRLAKLHGRSLEAEVRDILHRVPDPVTSDAPGKGWASALAERMREIGVTNADIDGLNASIQELRKDRRLHRDRMMLLLDTNVVSAMMRLHLEPIVEVWLGRQPQEQLFTTTTTIFELRHGIECKPKGKRRRVLETAFGDVIQNVLQDRIIPLDRVAAEAAGKLCAFQSKRGKTMSIPDSLIGGTALTLKVVLATGDIGDFAGIGLDLINPWDRG